MESLVAFKKQFDPELKRFLDQEIADFAKRDRLVALALQLVRKMVLAGGKRIRPALMEVGYVAAGGKDRVRLLEAAVSVELIHTFLLIHDDIIDFGEKRHGQETLHVRFSHFGKKVVSREIAKHFGESIAIVIGDMVNALGSKALFNSGFPAERIIRALAELQQIIALTVIGQTKDVHIEYLGQASEKEVLAMYEHKTAKYTFEGPLFLGAILAGADKKFLEKLSAYAVPVGIAFQIQDDIMGVFGSEQKTGKDAGLDIKEGKQTLLVVKALEKGTNQQKKILRQLLGKKDLTSSELKVFQNLIKETGALKYAEELAEKMVKQGKRALDQSGISGETRNFLLAIADYIIKREV